jgi:hypothetical protein
VEVRIDERGKYFTSHVNKQPQRVVVHTTQHLIVGTMHVQPDQRIIDALNAVDGLFLAITDAQVYTTDGARHLYASRFMMLACTHIIAVSPLETIAAATHALWGNPTPEESS